MGENMINGTLLGCCGWKANWGAPVDSYGIDKAAGSQLPPPSCMEVTISPNTKRL